MRGKYVSVNIPEELMKEIDDFLGKLGYRSRAEFTKEAVRRLLIELRELKDEGSKNIPS